MKKLLLILVALILTFSCLLLGSCGIESNKPKDLTGYFKALDSYSANMDIEVKNNKQKLNYSGRQIFCIGIGYKLELNDQRSLIYKGSKIYVTDLKSGKKYVTDEGFDDVYKLSFLGEYIGLLYTNQDIKYSFKTIDTEEQEIISTSIPANNKNISYGVLYIGVKDKAPRKLVIYDVSGMERIIVTYKAFSPNVDVDSKIFNTN